MLTETDILARIDPELAFALAEPPARAVELPRDIKLLRAANEAVLGAIRKRLPAFCGSIETIRVPGFDGQPEVETRFYRPQSCAVPDALMIWVHGGGFVAGGADDPAVFRYTSLLPVLSVEYRLAPEWRAPAAVQDVAAVLQWAADDAVALGGKRSMIVLAGASAGGGLALGAALYNRDHGGPPIDFLMLSYPMLDDRHETPSGHLPLPRTTWTRDLSLAAWSLYVEETGPSAYAAPARATSFHKLPPTYLMTGDLDLFRDETLAVAGRLLAQHVPVELLVVPGAVHAFDVLAPAAQVSRRAIQHQQQALSHALSCERVP